METAVLTNFPVNVTADMLRAEFWLARATDVDRVLLDAAGIAAFNARVPDRLGIPAVLALPDTLSAEDVRAAIAAYTRPSATRYGARGEPLKAAYFDRVIANATPELPDSVTVRFGLVTRRVDVRAFPTADVVTKRPFDFAFDRIQETTVDVGWPVAIVATSRDRQWVFGLTPHYWGWLRYDAVTVGTRKQVSEYAEASAFVTTLAGRGLVALSQGGGITPQMGTRLVLRAETEHAYRVAVPVRAADDTLQIVDGWAANTAGAFMIGFKPLTLRSLFEQAFKLLGEPYAWGGSQMGIFGRDCSRLVRDVYATTGVDLPRNGDQQGQVCHTQVRFAPEMDIAQRQNALVEQASPGAILELPGHVMLYLGHVDGVPYAIHDTSSSGYHGIIVSDLSLGADGESGSLLQRLTQAGVIA